MKFPAKKIILRITLIVSGLIAIGAFVLTVGGIKREREDIKKTDGRVDMVFPKHSWMEEFVVTYSTESGRQAHVAGLRWKAPSVGESVTVFYDASPSGEDASIDSSPVHWVIALIVFLVAGCIHFTLHRFYGPFLRKTGAA